MLVHCAGASGIFQQALFAVFCADKDYSVPVLLRYLDLIFLEWLKKLRIMLGGQLQQLCIADSCGGLLIADS